MSGGGVDAGLAVRDEAVGAGHEVGVGRVSGAEGGDIADMRQLV